MVKTFTFGMTITLAAALAACGKKDDGGAKEKPVEVEQPITCPPGNAAEAGKCVPVITAEKVAAVAQEKTRLEDLAKLLGDADAVVGAPIELLDGLRQTDQWKKIAGANAKLAIVDQVVATLNDGVKQLRVLKDGLAGAAVRFGNLGAELDKVLHDTGAAKQLGALRKQVSDELRAAIEPLAAELATAAEKVLVPVTAQVKDVKDLVLGACAMAKLSGGGSQLAALCAQAGDVLPKGVAYLEELKAKPATLFADLAKRLEAELGQLIDDQTRALLDTAQTKVNAALKLQPAPTTGSGSGVK